MQGLLSILGWVPPGGPAVWEVPMHPWEPGNARVRRLIGSARPGPMLASDSAAACRSRATRTRARRRSRPTARWASPTPAAPPPVATAATARREFWWHKVGGRAPRSIAVRTRARRGALAGARAQCSPPHVRVRFCNKGRNAIRPGCNKAGRPRTGRLTCCTGSGSGDQ